jgi:chromosome segregation ATPase
MGKVLGEFHDEVLREVAATKRELELLRQEFTVLREQVGLERELKDLRGQIETAKNQVPKLPELATRLEEGQARLQREVARTKDKLSRVRVNQSLTDHRLSKLSEATEARAAGMEMKFETIISSFVMREVPPDARAALRDFAAETLKGNRGETIWHFDPGPTAGTA